MSQEGPFGYSQRAAIKSTGQQSQQPQLDGLAASPANGEGYDEGVRLARRPGAPPRQPPTSAAIDAGGQADCENGQRGYMRRLSRFADPDFDIVTDPHIPGLQGPTYTGRAAGPARARASSREPETGAQVHDDARPHASISPRCGAVTLVLVMHRRGTYFAFAKEVPFRVALRGQRGRSQSANNVKAAPARADRGRRRGQGGRRSSTPSPASRARVITMRIEDERPAGAPRRAR